MKRSHRAMNIPCRRPLLSAALLSILLFCSGCPLLIGGAAAGAVIYRTGQLTATRNITLDEAYYAALQACEELGVTVVQKEKDGLTTLVVAMGAEEKAIRIRARKIFDDVTEVTIRVGTFGDELQSRILFDQMEQIIGSASGRSGVKPELPRTAPPAPRLSR